MILKLIFALLFNYHEGTETLIVTPKGQYILEVDYKVPHDGAIKSVVYCMPMNGEKNYSFVQYEETQNISKLEAYLWLILWDLEDHHKKFNDLKIPA